MGSQQTGSAMSDDDVSMGNTGNWEDSGLQRIMPSKHLYFRGSQHSVSVEGMGRFVGLAEADDVVLV